MVLDEKQLVRRAQLERQRREKGLRENLRVHNWARPGRASPKAGEAPSIGRGPLGEPPRYSSNLIRIETFRPPHVDQ